MPSTYRTVFSSTHSIVEGFVGVGPRPLDHGMQRNHLSDRTLLSTGVGFCSGPRAEWAARVVSIFVKILTRS